MPAASYNCFLEGDLLQDMCMIAKSSTYFKRSFSLFI